MAQPWEIFPAIAEQWANMSRSFSPEKMQWILTKAGRNATPSDYMNLARQYDNSFGSTIAKPGLLRSQSSPFEGQSASFMQQPLDTGRWGTPENIMRTQPMTSPTNFQTGPSTDWGNAATKGFGMMRPKRRSASVQPGLGFGQVNSTKQSPYGF